MNSRLDVDAPHARGHCSARDAPCGVWRQRSIARGGGGDVWRPSAPRAEVPRKNSLVRFEYATSHYQGPRHSRDTHARSSAWFARARPTSNASTRDARRAVVRSHARREFEGFLLRVISPRRGRTARRDGGCRRVRVRIFSDGATRSIS